MTFVKFTSATPNPEVAEVQDIAPEEVFEKRLDVKLVDVRREDEFFGELGHIKNAQLITLDQLEDHVKTLPKNQSIVFICRSGRRSITASLIAQQNGYEHTYNMIGGMILWNELGFEVER